jgi:predicted cupin superfamily sugar epimerase
MTVEFLVKELNLLPHPEGGYYKETYRSGGKIPHCLSPSYLRSFLVIEIWQQEFIF